MKRCLVLCLTAGACAGSAAWQMPDATPRLENPRFEEGTTSSGIPRGWTARGTQFAEARIVSDGARPHVLLLAARGHGSSGNDSFMLFQRLDPSGYRGKRIRFGASVRTDGAGVNLTLYTPERSANDFINDLHTAGYVSRSASLLVPDNASFLSFGVQILGPAGARAWIDDVFVEPEPQSTTGRAAPPGSPSGQGSARGPDAARVIIDTTTVEREISPLLFGMHIEWVEDGLGLLDPERLVVRGDVFSFLEPLRIPIFRFPGGIHADYYDWRNGVGPQARRPAGLNVFTSRQEPNHFGTDELIDLLRAIGSSALITANYGSGTAELAGQWAGYLRRAGVRADYWEVGNEIYLADPSSDAPNGRRIYHSPEQYARDFSLFRSAIKGVVPSARVGAIAHIDTGNFPLAPGSNRDWTARMLQELHVRPDFFAVHNAYAPVVIDGSGKFDDPAALSGVYRSLYAGASQIRENLDALDREIARRSSGSAGVQYAVTEFGPFFGLSGKPSLQAVYVDQTRTLAAALYVASVLDVLIGDPRVFMACYTNPIHKWFGGLLTNVNGTLVRTPTYYLYSLYRNRFESRLVRTSIESPEFNASALGLVKAHSGVPKLVGRAAIDQSGRRLTLMLVNRGEQRYLATSVTFKDFEAARADCQVLTADLPSARNGPGLTATTTAGEVTPRPVRCAASGGSMSLQIPPNAIVSVVLEK